MKRFNTILLLIIAFPLLSIFACSDDDDAGNGNTNTLVGTWNVDLIEINGSIAGIPVGETVVPTGTITFNDDFSGKENYSYSIPGVGSFNESSSFTWVATTATITFDPGDTDETVWAREVNESDRQRGRYTETTGDGSFTITITITK